MCSLHAGHNITIKSHPSPLYFAVGTTFNISCSYTSQYNFDCWVVPSNMHLQQSTGGYKVKNEPDMSGYTNTLTVESATNQDPGEYACIFSREDERFIEKINATLIEMVQITTETGLSYHVQMCEPVALNCTPLYHDSIMWIMLPDSKQVRNTSDGRVILLPDQLFIQEVVSEDNGTYTCLAKNRAGSVSITAELHIGMCVYRVCDNNIIIIYHHRILSTTA